MVLGQHHLQSASISFNQLQSASISFNQLTVIMCFHPRMDHVPEPEPDFSTHVQWAGEWSPLVEVSKDVPLTGDHVIPGGVVLPTNATKMVLCIFSGHVIKQVNQQTHIGIQLLIVDIKSKKLEIGNAHKMASILGRCKPNVP